MSSELKKYGPIVCIKKECKTWDGLMKWYKKLVNDVESRWIFRADTITENEKRKEGIEDPANDNLKSSLDKAFEIYDIKVAKRKRYEKGMIRKFQRKAGLYLNKEPDKDDILQWLAIMRHYGSPTRTLDWTYSFYVGAYFAIAERCKGVLWALNVNIKGLNDARAIKKKIGKVIKSDDKKRKRFNNLVTNFKKKTDFLGLHKAGDKLLDNAIACFLLDVPVPLIYCINPYKVIKRLTLQQGLLVIQGDTSKTFWENLREHLGTDLEKNLRGIKLKLEKHERIKGLKELKCMNISNEILFPDLTGFAKSVEEQMSNPLNFPKDL